MNHMGTGFRVAECGEHKAGGPVLPFHQKFIVRCGRV